MCSSLQQVLMACVHPNSVEAGSYRNLHAALRFRALHSVSRQASSRSSRIWVHLYMRTRSSRHSRILARTAVPGSRRLRLRYVTRKHPELAHQALGPLSLCACASLRAWIPPRCVATRQSCPNAESKRNSVRRRTRTAANSSGCRNSRGRAALAVVHAAAPWRLLKLAMNLSRIISCIAQAAARLARYSS